MARYDAATAEVIVLTFKEGLLSAVAHDLKLKGTAFVLEVEGNSVHLQLRADSLRVVNPMKNGADNPTGLPKLVYPEIEKNAAEAVLQAAKFPSIEFHSSSITETEVVGQLTLHGQTREVRGRRAGNSAEFHLDQRDFGIKPYSAMLGTLKVKPEVTIQVRFALIA